MDRKPSRKSGAFRTSGTSRNVGKTHGRPVAKKALPARRKPRPHRLTDAASAFLNSAEDIAEIFNAKRGTKGLSPFEGPIGTFKRSAYALIRDTLAKPGGLRTLKNIESSLDIESRSFSDRRNPFYLGLLAFDENRKLLKPQELYLFANQMLYAHRHNVPAYFLIGFLYQTGKQRLIVQKVVNDVREAWFEKLTTRSQAGVANAGLDGAD